MTMRSLMFEDEQGFTTAGAAVAILLALALVFAGVHVSRTSNQAGDIQYIADAGALAADNTVAEFVTMGQVVDAAILSMSLLGLTAYAVSAVAAFIPGAQGAATKIASAGSRVLDVRSRFAKSAVKGLDAAQKALPALCAVRAAACVQQNSNAKHGSYYGFAVPVPLEGISYELPDLSEVDEAAETIESEQEKTSKRANEAQDLQESIDAAKEAAWRADCGKQGMNMRERAGHLAGLSGSKNPNFASVETWTFAAALKRAREYYAARYRQEPGSASDGSPELVAESVARKRFYAYALETVSKGAVGTGANGEELPRFEKLARKTAQIRATELVREAVYPVSERDGVRTLHAYTGCPGYAAGTSAGLASVSAIDNGSVAKCEHCKFSATTLGRVPAASTSIGNGFEYYYRIVAEEADKYKAAVERADKVKKELRESRSKVTEAFEKGLESIASLRYDPQPPGRYGCICIACALPQRYSGNGFFSADAKMGARVAISGASLAVDASSDQNTIVHEIGENLISQQSLGSGVVKTLFGAWGNALKFYTDGTSAVTSTLNKTLGAVPFVGTELSDWAVSGFKDAVKKAGLEPANLQTYKPVLVNSSHIAAQDGSGASKLILKLKTAGQAYGDVSVGDFQALAETLELPQAVRDAIKDGKLVLATMPLSKLGGDAQDVDIGIEIPPDIQQRLSEIVNGSALVQAKGG